MKTIANFRNRRTPFSCLRRSSAAVLLLVAARVAVAQGAADPLPSWNDGPHKTAILDFVTKVTQEGGPDFVPPAERIATFDNDGTLWCEQPDYVQAVFALARVHALAAQHPEWQTQEPFKSILAGDLKTALAGGEKALLQIVAATHTGMTIAQFEKLVTDWLATAQHPRFHRPYTELAYQPMIEVLAYLRANGFKTFIVSGGGVEFMRPWTERVYGVPPEQVVGSSGKLKYEVHDGKPLLMKTPELNFVDDGPGKPVGIEQFIGRQPILAFGNSDGDFEMLQWTTTPTSEPGLPRPRLGEPGRPRPRLGLIVHHTDAEREYAYDHPSAVGQLQRTLDEAKTRGWIVIDMKRDWNTVFSTATSK